VNHATASDMPYGKAEPGAAAGHVQHGIPPHREVGPRSGAQVLTQSCGCRFKTVLRGTFAP
jgi:hypothetical protein